MLIILNIFIEKSNVKITKICIVKKYAHLILSNFNKTQNND